MKKSTVSLLAALSLLITFCFPTYAVENQEMIRNSNGEIVMKDGEVVPKNVSPSEQLRELKEKGFSSQQIAEAKEKLSGQFIPEPQISTRASWVYHSPRITFYRQIDKVHCIHACTQMTLKYFGITISQRDLEGLDKLPTSPTGTHLTYVPGVLNSMQKNNAYVFIDGTNCSREIMQNHLYSSIVNYDAPAIIGVTIDKAAYWPYYDNVGSPGHGLVVSGATIQKTEFELTDPISGFVGGGIDMSKTPQKYTTYSTKIYYVVNKKDMGYAF